MKPSLRAEEHSLTRTVVYPESRPLSKQICNQTSCRLGRTLSHETQCHGKVEVQKRSVISSIEVASSDSSEGHFPREDSAFNQALSIYRSVIFSTTRKFYSPRFQSVAQLG